MRRKNIFKRIMSFITAITLLLSTANVTALANTQNSSEVSAAKYFNASVKYLYLGIQESNSFDFNIRSNAKEKGASYSWYINSSKGTPDAVTIDAKTGIVTAREVGTAYILCKIKHSDGSIIEPEAKVIVINNITKVDLADIPANNTVTVGDKVVFNEKILNTAAGKDIKTQGITRYEIKDDAADVNNVSADGVLCAQKPGDFKIRAVCFQNNSKYKLWLSDKATYAELVTAASGWVTIHAISAVVSAAPTAVPTSAPKASNSTVEISSQFPDEYLAKTIADWLGMNIHDQISKDIINIKLYSIETDGSGENDTLKISAKAVNMQGFEIFNGTNLKRLSINGGLTDFDASGLTELTHLDLGNNNLASVKVNGLSKLKFLSLNNNKLTSVNLDGLTCLQYLKLDDNQLTDINLNDLPNLNYLDVSNNRLAKLDFSRFRGSIQYLYISPLTDAQINNFYQLNQLTSSDVVDCSLANVGVNGVIDYNPYTSDGIYFAQIPNESPYPFISSVNAKDSRTIANVVMTNSGVDIVVSGPYASSRTYHVFGTHISKANSTITISPASFQKNTDATVTVILKDINGKPVTLDNQTLKVDAPSNLTYSSLSSTAEPGTYTFTLRCSQAGTQTVSVWVAGFKFGNLSFTVTE